MNDTIFSKTPGQGEGEQPLPVFQEAGLGEAASASEAAIEQIVAEKQSESDLPQAYIFIP